VTVDKPNPYAAPQAPPSAAPETAVDPASLKRIEAIIKDAGQFWLAILMCFFCTGLGAVIIGPWYLVRLVQWNAIARGQPMLLDPNVPRGSLARRFQSAKTKLIIGIAFGAVTLLLAIVFMAGLAVSG
jgi:hypothetical protein